MSSQATPDVIDSSILSLQPIRLVDLQRTLNERTKANTLRMKATDQHSSSKALSSHYFPLFHSFSLLVLTSIWLYISFLSL